MAPASIPVAVRCPVKPKGEAEILQLHQIDEAPLSGPAAALEQVEELISPPPHFLVEGRQ
jgi:hypothetical protein